jgi:CRISPR-associated endonuclease/helicase Cas3
MLPGLGRVVVFSPAGRSAPKSMRSFQAAASGVLRDHEADPLSLDAVQAYFRQLYFHKGTEALDAAEVGSRPGILAAIRDGANGFRYPFRSIATAFRMIEDTMWPVAVPWNEDAVAALDRVAFADRPSREDFRALQRFTVGIPKRAIEEWLAAGVILPVRQELGNAILRFVDDSLYRPLTGVDLANPTFRDADQNIFA